MLNACASVIIGMSAGFQDIVKTDEVALDIHVWMIDGIADASLRGEVDHDRRLVGPEDLVYKSFVSNAALHKNMPYRGRDRIDDAKAVLLEVRIIIIIHIVEADHSAACKFAAQAHHQVGADEAGRAGDQNRSAVQIYVGFAHIILLYRARRVTLRSRLIVLNRKPCKITGLPFGRVLVPSEQVSRVNLVFHVIQRGIVAVCDDAAAHALELLEVVHNLGARIGACHREQFVNKCLLG